MTTRIDDRSRTVSAEARTRRRPLLSVARFVSLSFSGLFAGFLITVLVLELSMRPASGFVYIVVRHVELMGLDVLATVLLIPAIVTTAIVVGTRFSAGGVTRWLPVIALLLMVSVLVLTVIVNLPINAEQHGWEIPPPDWASIRDRWQLAHAVRTVAAVVAFGCLGFGEIRKP